MSNNEEILSLNQLRKNILNYDLFLKTTQEGLTKEEISKRSDDLKIDEEKIIHLLDFKENLLEEKSNYLFTGGLTIGNITLHKLNGPSSLRILIPKEKKYKNTIRPVIFLLGDIHRKISGFCDHCNCWDQKDCCMYSFDTTFLQLLDRQTNGENPISIYVEEFRETNRKDQDQLEIDLEKKTNNYRYRNFEEKLKVGELLLEFKINFSDCFRPLKEKLENTCPTNNIQWNYTDIRQAPLTIENMLYFYLDGSKPEYLNNIKTLLDDLFSLKSLKFVKALLSSTKSRIGKQIVKAGLNLNKEIDHYISPYFDYVWNKPFLLYNKKLEKIYLNLTKANIKNINSFYYNKKDISSICISKNEDIFLTPDNIGSIVVQLTSPLVELYSYYRMIKQLYNIIPQSTIQSYPLVINILGEDHVKNYQYFLTHIKKEYDIYWSSQDQQEIKDQCVLFTDLNFNLNQIFPKEVKYQEKNSHFTAVKNFRKYLLGNIYTNMIKNNTIYSDDLLQLRIKKINEIRPDLNMTLEKLKDLTEYDNLIKEIEINKSEKVDEKMLKFATPKNLKYAMKKNNIPLTKKILEQPHIEIDLNKYYLPLSDFLRDNYTYPVGHISFDFMDYLDENDNLPDNIDQIESSFITYDEYTNLKRKTNESAILEIIELFYKKAGIPDYKNEAKEYFFTNTFDYNSSKSLFYF